MPGDAQGVRDSLGYVGTSKLIRISPTLSNCEC